MPWRDAWRSALYGPGGFYRRPEGPAGHFRTASSAGSPDLAAAVLALAARHGCRSIVDVGAGRGELLTAIVALHDRSDRPEGLRLHGVDVVARPRELPAGVGWSRGLRSLPAQVFEEALVVAFELLDVVPCPVLEVDGEGRARTVLVDPRSGRERLGGPAPASQLAWCRRWWPIDPDAEGSRVEVGAPRDRCWASLVGRLAAGGGTAALAVDYGHRRAERPPLGSLTGFRAGRAVPPRPDGSSDVTAHVALDAVAAAGERAGAARTRLTTQAAALGDLGARDPELLDPGGLGGFGWLLQQLPRGRQ